MNPIDKMKAAAKEGWSTFAPFESFTGSAAPQFEYENFEDYWSSFLSGDGTPGSMVMGLAPEHRATLQEQVRHVFLSGKPDGFRSFLASAWICKGIVPETT